MLDWFALDQCRPHVCHADAGSCANRSADLTADSRSSTGSFSSVDPFANSHGPRPYTHVCAKVSSAVTCRRARPGASASASIRVELWSRECRTAVRVAKLRRFPSHHDQHSESWTTYLAVSRRSGGTRTVDCTNESHAQLRVVTQSPRLPTGRLTLHNIELKTVSQRRNH